MSGAAVIRVPSLHCSEQQCAVALARDLGLTADVVLYTDDPDWRRTGATRIPKVRVHVAGSAGDDQSQIGRTFFVETAEELMAALGYREGGMP